MCDFLPGRLIVSHHQKDAAASALIADIVAGRIEHVSYGMSMRERLYAANVHMPEGFAYEQHLLFVRDGEELWKINYLRFFYQAKIMTLAPELQQSTLQVILRSDSHLLVVPDSVLSASNAQKVGFTFDAIHAQYKKLLATPVSPASGSGTTIAVLDTGLDASTGISPAAGSRAFHDDTATTQVDDVNGHGTVVSSIIYDIAPRAAQLILKVGDRNPISEWNVLAALLSATSADIINISLAFGMPFRNCPTCGRGQTHSSRSAVFEQTIDELLRLRPESIIVAAAGNRQQNKLDFPARFANVLAVGALDSKLNRPTYSNYGAQDHIGKPHSLLFFAPGGGNGEFVASTVSGQHEGTSFAAPYVSGLVAAHISRPGPRPNRTATLAHFRSLANRNLPGFNAAEYGNGLIQA